MNLTISNITSVALLWLTLTMLPVSGLLKQANQSFYDFLLTLGWTNRVAENAPLVITLDDWNKKDWASLIIALQQAGVKEGFILGADKRQLSVNLPVPSSFSLRVVQNLARFNSYSSTLQEKEFSVLIPPKNIFGAARMVSRASMTPKGLANHYAQDYWPENQKEILINFQMFETGILRLSAEQVLKGQAIPELASGRIVLLGWEEDFSEPGYFIPGLNLSLNLLEMEAMLWVSLLNESGVTFLSTFYSIFLVLGVSLILQLGMKWLSPKQALVLALAFVILLALIMYLFIQRWFVVLPFWECTVALGIIFFSVIHSRFVVEDTIISRMLADTNVVLSERISPVSFNDSDDPWRKIVVLISQQLSLEKSILFERVPDDHRLREIQSLNCSLEDIYEKRRDFKREPYASAIAEQEPVRINRDFFKNRRAEEEEYIVPLMFANKILGFWALTVKQPYALNIKNHMREFAIEIGELIFHRQHNQQKRSENKRLWRSFLRLNQGRHHVQHLADALTLIEKRLDTYEEVFSGLSSASILYDLFGQVLQVNEKMEALAKALNIQFFNMSFLDLIREACNLSLEDARAQLRQVTLKKHPLYLPVKSIEKNKTYLLYVRPIQYSEKKHKALIHAQESRPFKLLGILFEFVDVSSVQDFLEYNDDLYGQFFHTIRNQMNRIAFATKKIQRKSQEFAQPIATIEEAMGDSVAMIKILENRIWNNIESRELSAIGPVSLTRIINKVLSDTQKLFASKYLKLQKDIPFSVSLVFANASTLRTSLTKILTLLVEDSAQNTTLYIAVNELSGPPARVKLTLKNEGFGMPESQLNQVKLDAENLDDSDPISEAVASLTWVEYWGGLSNVESKVGEGFKFELLLAVHDIV